jgi:O-antigen/teichoic acid export membrane protein
LHPLKRLASQTAIYGLSSVLGRFLNYLLVPLYTYVFAPAEYGVVSEFYAYMGFLAVLLLFGLETGYFRFRDDAERPAVLVYATALRVVVVAALLFCLALYLWRQPLADLLQHPGHPEYLWWVGAILALDAIGAMAFARLRAENQAVRFAGIKGVEIGVNVLLNLWFILYCRQAFAADPGSLAGQWWNPAIGVGYIFIANLAASGVKLVLVAPQLRAISVGFDRALCGRLLRYSLPMVVIGFAGIINEMLDRAALKYLLPYDLETNLAQLGIYSACYKLSILMSLFIQAFRYAGEPFFFAYAHRADARQTYAEVLRFFVIFCVFIYLLVTLYLDLFQYFIGASYRAGLHVVPVLLLANLLLGIYVNLSIWYKLSDRTLLGSAVALAGSAITIPLLWWWVPAFGYQGAAWAHLACYGSMVLISWGLGRRYYPVPYEWGRLGGYILLGLGIHLAHGWLLERTGVPSVVSGSIGLGLFLLIAYRLDGVRLRRPAA